MSLLKSLLMSQGHATGAVQAPDMVYRKSHDLVGSTSLELEGLIKSASNPIWSTADYAWSVKTAGNERVLRDPDTGAPVLYDGKYWMAYTPLIGGVTDGIGLATSVDLVNWSDEAGNPIIKHDDGDVEAWEAGSVSSSDFLYMGNEAGHSYDFWIFYRGYNAGFTETKIGIIKSNDMATWVRDLAHNPVVDWVPGFVGDCTGVEDFTAQKTSAGNWMALYEADQFGVGAHDAAIGAASCSETLPHTGWADEGQVCSGTFGAVAITNPVVIRVEIGATTYYYGFYEWISAVGPPTKAHTHGMYCTEANIFTLDAWTQLTDPQIRAESGWEDLIVIPSGLVRFEDRLYLFYGADTQDSKETGLAISPIGVADYQIKIVVNYGAGADSGEDVYLDSKCEADFGDIRFSQEGTELDYWIQKKVDSDYAIFWVEVLGILPSPNTATIYIYYGKEGETTSESGANTWIEYEDWEGYAVDAVLPLGLFEALDIGEVCKIDDNRAYKGTKSLYCDDDSAVNRNQMVWNYADKIAGGYRFFSAVYQETDYASVAPQLNFIYKADPPGNAVISLKVEGDGDIMDYYTGGWHDTGADLTEGAWHVFEICARLNVATWDFRFDGVWYLNRAVRESLVRFIYSQIMLAGVSDQFRGNLGVCLIGKYVDPEPTHDAWGAEEPILWPF